MIKSFISMLKNDDGATLVEYVLIIALIVGISITAMRNLGNSITNGLGRTAGTMQAQVNQIQ